MPKPLEFRRPETLRAQVTLWMHRLRRWLAYKPERRYMRGAQAG
jgi:hypothetical protein